MALSGNFNNYPTSQFGLYCEWTAKQSMWSNSTEITVNVYLHYYNIVTGQCNGEIGIGDLKGSFVSESVDDMYANAWTNTLIGTYTGVLKHNADGTLTGIPLTVKWDFQGTYDGEEINTIIASTIVDIDPITTYTLSLSTDDNVAIVAERTSTSAGETGVLSNGARLYYSDRLKITFILSDGYQISSRTVNGVNFVSGGTMIVDGDVSVAVTSQGIIKQSFSPENMRCYDSKGRTIRALYQWDENVNIRIKDVAITPPPVFQFSNRKAATTVDVASSVDGDDLVVSIPNELLRSPEAIFAHIRRSTGSGRRTLGVIYLPVRARQKPADAENTNE